MRADCHFRLYNRDRARVLSSRNAVCVQVEVPDDATLPAILAAARSAGAPIGNTLTGVYEVQTDRGIFDRPDKMKLDGSARRLAAARFRTWAELEAAEQLEAAELAEQRDELEDTCPYCGEDLLLSGALDVRQGAGGERFLEWSGCCEAMQHDAERGAVSWEGLAELVTGSRPRRVEAGQAVERGREVDLADVDGLLVHRLEVSVVTGGEAQRRTFDRVQASHRHHKQRPVGWHFGLEARRGGVLVAVAVCGRPVSRTLQSRGVVEVTRVCVLPDVDSRLARDAASAIYRAALAEYARRRVVASRRGDVRVTELVTYTLPSESGASLRGAGFRCDGAAGGGSWGRTGRPRIDAHPTCAKLRWSAPVNGGQS